jgi:hypothetical protein
MCNYFYEWDIDKETGYRKVILQDVITEFITEKEKFASYDGEYKKCTKCFRLLPKNDYFFKVASREKDGLSFQCKECKGYKFSWGKTEKYKLINNGFKYCQSCDIVFPLNELYFSKTKTSKADGHSSYCKKCVSGCNYGINRNINEIVKTVENHKLCLLCFVELPKNEEYYFKSSQKSDGLEVYCKKCQGIEYGVVYLNKVYKDLIPEDKKYCYECKRLLGNDLFANSKDKSDGKASLCIDCQRIFSHKRRENKLNNNYTNNNWQIAKQYWTDNIGKIHCAYCNEITDNPTLEHVIPFSKGGQFTIDNIIPVCQSCNSSKRDKDLEDYYNYSEKFTEELYIKVINYVNEMR